jgi:transcription antitermination factor NusG
MSVSMVERWYALQVRSRYEKAVFTQLEAKQHVVFLPLYAAKHKWADRWKTVLLPLFSGYVFCRFDSEKRASVLATSGVIDVVRTGSQPAPIETTEIEAIRKVVDSPVFKEPYAGLVNGQRVMMTDGPLTGLTGTLMESKKNLRLVISMELLNRSIMIEIESDWVAPCQPLKPDYGRLIACAERRSA